MVVRRDEVGQSGLEAGSELHLNRQRWLEEDRGVAVCIELRNEVISNLRKVPAVRVCSRNLHNAVTPLLLGGLDHSPCHIAGTTPHSYNLVRHR